MSSDYIARLRSELLRAGASEQPRWRPARVARGLRPLAVTAVAALVAVAVVLALADGGNDETAVDQAAGSLRLTYRVEGPVAATADVMRERLSAAGVDGADVSVSATGSLTISAPADARADVTALEQTGRLAFYDWERSVLGPVGEPAPKAEAEARAARSPGARVVRAENAAPDAWFALGGRPALTDADIASAEPGVDESTRPVVTIEFTDSGKVAFGELTRGVAQRGSERAAPGEDPIEAAQHFAIVLDDRIVSTPFIDFRESPDGIHGADGAMIEAGLTPETARRMAAILSSGPLPGKLVLQSEDVGG
jgi:preprotein translocase subunit SecD